MKMISLPEIAPTSVSHDPDISKCIMIGPDEVRGLTQFACAVIRPGQATQPHSHRDMVEVFFVADGSGRLEVNGEAHPLKPGDCLRIDPGETHCLAAGAGDRLEIIYFGIAAAAEASEPPMPRVGMRPNSRGFEGEQPPARPHDSPVPVAV